MVKVLCNELPVLLLLFYRKISDSVGLQSQTSESQVAAENIAFLVGALCRPAGFPRKETFKLRLELRHGLGHGLGLVA